MSRFKVIPIFTLLFTMVLSAYGTINLAPANGNLILNSSNDFGLTLTSELAEIEHLNINTPEGLFTLLQVDDYSYSHRIGEPQLPVKRTIIAVPLGAAVTASVTESWIEQFSLTDWGITDPVIPAQPSLSKGQLPEDVELKAGIQLEITRQDDSVLNVMVVKVTKKTVTLDANHPLAGKSLTFKIQLLEVVKDPPEAKMMEMLSAKTPPMTPPM